MREALLFCAFSVRKYIAFGGNRGIPFPREGAVEGEMALGRNQNASKQK